MTYYTPKIDDFFIGYEYEMDSGYDWCPQIFPAPWWHESSMGGIESLGRCLTNAPIIRTKYLTKEAIQSEGWEYGGTWRDTFDSSMGLTSGIHTFNHGDHALSFDIYNKEAKITLTTRSGIPTNKVIYVGLCPSINELRLIQKLLKIK